MFCKAHYLLKKHDWYQKIKYKFFKTDDWLVDKIAKYSAYDVELMMRETLENLYINKTNLGLEKWKNKFF